LLDKVNQDASQETDMQRSDGIRSTGLTSVVVLVALGMTEIGGSAAAQPTQQSTHSLPPPELTIEKEFGAGQANGWSFASPTQHKLEQQERRKVYSW